MYFFYSGYIKVVTRMYATALRDLNPGDTLTVEVCVTCAIIFRSVRPNVSFALTPQHWLQKLRVLINEHSSKQGEDSATVKLNRVHSSWPVSSEMPVLAVLSAQPPKVSATCGSRSVHHRCDTSPYTPIWRPKPRLGQSSLTTPVYNPYQLQSNSGSEIESPSAPSSPPIPPATFTSLWKRWVSVTCNVLASTQELVAISSHMALFVQLMQLFFLSSSKGERLPIGGV